MALMDKETLNDPVVRHMRKNFSALAASLTVGEALDAVRNQGLKRQIVYFYVVDEQGRLAGVLPTRKLLTMPLEQKLSEIMDKKVLAIPESFTVMDACELFVLHKFLAFPVVAKDRRLLGVVDVSLYASEVLGIAETEISNEVFESLGLHLEQLRNASFLRRFRARFSWLLTTLGSGLLCALMAGVFEKTLAESVTLAFFLTLVLALGESVCVQSLSLSLDMLRHGRPNDKKLIVGLWRELSVSFCMGIAASLLAGGFSYVWKKDLVCSGALSLGVLGAVAMAALIGFFMPVLLHHFKLDLKVAAGPVALAIADVGTVICYLSAATMLLPR